MSWGICLFLYAPTGEKSEKTPKNDEKMAFLSIRVPFQIKFEYIWVYLDIFSPQNHALHLKLH